ncbi:MAG: hypothetical protein KAH30_02555 [Caldisericia bacterium]|nr:hypothetical protein [Caldisericia bacterium]
MKKTIASIIAGVDFSEGMSEDRIEELNSMRLTGGAVTIREEEPKELTTEEIDAIFEDVFGLDLNVRDEEIMDQNSRFAL